MNPCPDNHRRVQIIGTVAGIQACQLLSDHEEIVVGSGLDCDLVVADPLVPRRAFRLRCEKSHHGMHEPCDCRWVIEAVGAARVCLNGRLTRRDRITFGDVIGIGCHRLAFDQVAPTRNAHGNVQVEDLCSALTGGVDPPEGYLSACASRAARSRTRRAMRLAGAVALVLLLLALLLHRDEAMTESVAAPMEVAMIGPVRPAPDAVRSLEQVERRTVREPTSPEAADMEELSAPPIEGGRAEPLAMRPTMDPSVPSPARLETAAVDVGPSDDRAPLTERVRESLAVRRDVEKLQSSAPRRRLTQAEAAQPAMAALLGRSGELEIPAESTPASYRRYKLKPAGPAPVPSRRLDTGGPTQLEALERYGMSELAFETHRGKRIPVARVPDKLETLAVDPSAGEIKMDGKITDVEVAASWKSGQFRLHGPGNPPKGKPPTFCYVARTEIDGKTYLYISFTCMDPDVSKLVTGNARRGGDKIVLDDSVEIFLDVDFDRTDYHQLIVNAKGDVWSGYFPKPGEMGPGPHRPWKSAARAKATINREAKRWVCEVLVPFDRLGGVPKKGDRWAVNFCRNFRGQTDDEHLQTWFLVYDGHRNFHNPELFGVFQW